MINRVLSKPQLQQYHSEGYLLVRNAISPDTLALARTVLERWVDKTIGSWVQKGLLPSPLSELDFEHRLVKAWETAGRPKYSRSPRRDLVSPELFQFLSQPELLNLAEELLGTPEVYLHGVFNARPKLPDQKWTDTPWHQDAQYFRDAETVHVVTMWMPLQPVTERNSCLQVAPGLHHGVLHASYEDKESGFIGLSPEARADLNGISIEMNPGDILCFTQKTPHRALPNLSDAVRWSMDLRYEATPTATASGRKQGFVARSHEAPYSVETYEEWLKKWENIPEGSY